MGNEQGYINMALGEKYIDESFNFIKSLRKINDLRPVSVVTEDKWFQYAKSKGVYDKIITLKYDKEYLDICNHHYERYGILPKLYLPDNLPYEHNIMVDVDILCIGDPEKVWKFFMDTGYSLCTTGLVEDHKWHFGYIDEVSKRLSLKLSHTNGGMIYFKKSDEMKIVSGVLKDVFKNYTKYGCRKQFKSGGMCSEILFSVAMAKMGYKPLDFYEYPIQTFSYLNNISVPNFTQTANFNKVVIDKPYSFIHIPEKRESKIYRTIYRNLFGHDEPKKEKY